jgi:hypothetical protein
MGISKSEVKMTTEFDGWLSVKDGDDRARALYLRHYSARHYKDGRKRSLFVGPGEKMVLMTANCDALFIWRKFIDDSVPIQSGVNCAIFRNESQRQSSDLIHLACDIAWQRWPGERLYTYVNARRIRSSNPGYCFLKAGWRRCGQTKGRLVVLEILSDGIMRKRRQL